jgi:hypothetical protein
LGEAHSGRYPRERPWFSEVSLGEKPLRMDKWPAGPNAW